MIIENKNVSATKAERDSVDRFVEMWSNELPQLDPAVEGIVERIQFLDKKLRRSMEETLADTGLELGEWKTLAHLRRSGAPYQLSAGKLSSRANLSTGAMTNRLDRLETAGLVRRLPHPPDRRGVLVELTPKG